jgi:hypothetical protein
MNSRAVPCTSAHNYRVMFGGFIESGAKDDLFIAEARAA